MDLRAEIGGSRLPSRTRIIEIGVSPDAPRIEVHVARAALELEPEHEIRADLFVHSQIKINEAPEAVVPLGLASYGLTLGDEGRRIGAMRRGSHVVGLLGVAQGIGERPVPRYRCDGACHSKSGSLATPSRSLSTMARTILLVVVAAVVAWAAYAYFTHSGPLPNFHW